MENHTEKGIIPIVMGGLGNQMFIVAAAIVAAKEHDCPVYIIEEPVSNNKHNLLNHNYNDTIFKYAGIRLPIQNKSQDFLRFVHANQYGVHIPNGFQPWHPSEISRGTLMNSYYQFYPTLEPHESNLRSIFHQGLQPYRDAFRLQTETLARSAFLHIRRGDYLDVPTIHYIQSISYYQTCVMRLLSEKGLDKLYTIYVLSDDIEWVRSQPFFQNTLFTIYDSKDELLTLALMSLCGAGAICANSTFSWWGAFLGPHAKRAPVFVPSNWIGGTSMPVALFPDEWSVV